MFIIEWFTSMNLAGQIFTCIAVPATLVLLVQTIMMFIGVGSSDGEIGEELPDEIPNEMPDDLPDEAPEGVFGNNEVGDIVDSAGLEGLKIFTVRGIIAFLVVFGWVGVVMDGYNNNLILTIVVATLSGGLAMLVLAWLYRVVMKLRNDGNTDNKNAVGTSGKVQLLIPAERAGEGKIHLMLQGAYVERDAVTDDKEPIPTGSEVVVIGVSGQTTLVVRRK